LWVLASPYVGAFAGGYKLAQWTLGQLTAAFRFSNVNPVQYLLTLHPTDYDC